MSDQDSDFAAKFVAQCKAKRAAEVAAMVAKLENGKAAAVIQMPQPKPKPKVLPKPKVEVEVATPEVIAADYDAPLLERTIRALGQLNFDFSYDSFRHKYHIGDHTLQQRIGANVEHAILVLRTMITSQFKFDPGPERMKAAVYGPKQRRPKSLARV
jgi:hypothetical protein